MCETVSIRICQEGHANALAMNKESTQIAVAGRSLLKVYALVDDDGFQEKCNMRAGKNHNLSYSCNDVTWSHLEGNFLATAATNGVVSVFDLSRFGRQKQLLTYNEHERTAHSVEFHKQDPYFLISCSQDGTVKRFDTRHEKSVTTFYSNSESVRDVKFSPGNPYTFAAASENGQVQLWDTRRPDRCTSQFTAHSEPIYTCDWHPTTNWLATGSRDKQIKIWSIGTGEIDPVYSISTIAVVGRVRWRPEKQYEIASCALVMDYSIYLWDVRRPFIPYASFNDHTNVTTDIAFKGDDPYKLLSTSKDSTIYRHSLRDAIRSSANPQGASINFRGDLVFANKLKTVAAAPGSDAIDGSGQPEKKVDLFHLAKSSLVTFPSTARSVEDSKSYREYLALKGFAKEYKLSGPLSEICDHNVEVAKRYSKTNVAVLWKWTKMFYGNVEDVPSEQTSRESGGTHLSGGGSHLQLVNRMSGGDESLQGHLLHADRGLMAQQLLDEKMTIDKQLPKPFDARGNGLSGPNNLCTATEDVDFILFDRELTIESVNLLRHGFLYTGDICKEMVFPSLSTCNDLNATQSTEAVQAEPNASPNQTLLKVSIPAVPCEWEPYSVLSDSLHNQADIGDVQTPACILIALGSNRRAKLTTISEVDHENWLQAYVEQLHKHGMFNEGAEIINFSWLASIGGINEQSTAVHTNCGVCLKPMSSREGGYHCTKCHSSETSHCSVCQSVVRGIYSWCSVCGHGGHIKHVQDWFTTHSKCPTCGHLCEYD